MIVSRSRALQPQYPDLFIVIVPLTTNDSFKNLGVTYDRKFTFQSHLHSSVIAQHLGLLRKSLKICGDQLVLLKYFNSFILPCFEYCSPVCLSVADLYLKLFDRNLNDCKFLVPAHNTDLWHHRSISCLCRLFKIYDNPALPLHQERPSLFHAVRETRNAVKSHSHSFSVVSCSTAQYSTYFILASIRCWTGLLGGAMEFLKLQEVKGGANKFLLD